MMESELILAAPILILLIIMVVSLCRTYKPHIEIIQEITEEHDRFYIVYFVYYSWEEQHMMLHEPTYFRRIHRIRLFTI